MDFELSPIVKEARRRSARKSLQKSLSLDGGAAYHIGTISENGSPKLKSSTAATTTTTTSTTTTGGDSEDSTSSFGGTPSSSKGKPPPLPMRKSQYASSTTSTSNTTTGSANNAPITPSKLRTTVTTPANTTILYGTPTRVSKGPLLLSPVSEKSLPSTPPPPPRNVTTQRKKEMANNTPVYRASPFNLMKSASDDHLSSPNKATRSPSIAVIRKSLPRCSDTTNVSSSEAQRQGKEWAMLNVDSPIIQSSWRLYFEKHGADISMNSEMIALIKRVGTSSKYRAKQWLALTSAKSNLSVSAAFKAGCKDIPALQLKDIIAQIKIDVPRTVPHHPFFYEGIEDNSRNGRLILERVLVAFVFLHPNTSYLQGMNFIAAFLLIVFDLDEDAALTVLTNLVFERLPGYFASFAALQRDTALLKYLLEMEDPALSKHLLQEGDMDFDIATISPNWLLTLYFNVFPPKMVLRIWDCMLCMPTHQTSGYLIRVGLSIFRVVREDLLKCDSLGDVYSVLQGLQLKFDDPLLCEKLIRDILRPDSYILSDQELESLSFRLEHTKSGLTTENKWVSTSSTLDHFVPTSLNLDEATAAGSNEITNENCAPSIPSSGAASKMSFPVTGISWTKKKRPPPLVAQSHQTPLRSIGNQTAMSGAVSSSVLEDVVDGLRKIFVTGSMRKQTSTAPRGAVPSATPLRPINSNLSLARSSSQGEDESPSRSPFSSLRKVKISEDF